MSDVEGAARCSQSHSRQLCSPRSSMVGGAAIFIAGLAIGALAGSYFASKPENFPTWRAHFFENQYLNGAPSATVFYPALDFDWLNGSMLPGIDPSLFSARFETTIKIENDTVVSFAVQSDDGVRLQVDDEQLIDTWGPLPYIRSEKSKLLKRGDHIVVLEFLQLGGDAKLRLEVKREDTPWSIFLGTVSK